MILEAFSDYLKSVNHPMTSERVADAVQSLRQKYMRRGMEHAYSRAVLRQWLVERLQLPAQNHVDRVIQMELMLMFWQGDAYIEPVSASGERLLSALEAYCDSYDHWQFGRFIHNIHASDFPQGTL